MSEIKKTAVVSVVGRPNVGKSTLTNKLVGFKVAIVSNKPQTTRTRITGVCTKGDCQYVFLDTPGLHKPRSRLGDFMVKVVNDTVAEVDVAVLVVDPVANVGHAEQQLIEQIKNNRIPSILVINKIDTLPHEEILAIIAAYSEKHDGPSFELIKRVSEACQVPVIAEGKINTPEDLAAVFAAGAYSAVVGGAITRPKQITERFVRAISGSNC